MDMDYDCLQCIICMDFLQNAHLCPKCSKLCCYRCISEWLDTSENCPQCHGFLQLELLIKCRWIDDLSTGLAKMSLEMQTVSVEMEKLSADKDILMIDRMIIKEEKRTVAEENEKITQEKELLSVERQIVEENKKKIAEDAERAIQEKDALAAEKKKFAAEKAKFQNEKGLLELERAVLEEEKSRLALEQSGNSNVCYDLCLRENNAEKNIRSVPVSVLLKDIEVASKMIATITQKIRGKKESEDEGHQCFEEEVKILRGLYARMNSYEAELLERKELKNKLKICSPDQPELIFLD